MVRTDGSASGRTALVILEGTSVDGLASGRFPHLLLSHDRGLLQIAEELIRLGYEVHASDLTHRKIKPRRFRLLSVYPVERAACEEPSRYDLVFSIHATRLGAYKPADATGTKCVLVLPALFFTENTTYWHPRFVRDYTTALHETIDFVMVQNARMKEIFGIFAKMLFGWDKPERILVTPFAPTPSEETTRSRSEIRKDMGVSDDDVVIINSGGTWKWTDFLTFLEAFSRHCIEFPESRIHVFIMGFRQKNANDHGEYIDSIENFFLENPADPRIHIIRDWDTAGALLEEYTHAADIGLNINKDTLENWQSRRVRVLDYARAGLALLNTEGDTYHREYRDCVYSVIPEDAASYRKALLEIETDREGLASRRKAMATRFVEIASNEPLRTALKEIVEAPPLEPSTPQDAYTGDRPRTFAERLSRSIKKRLKVLR